MPLRGRLNLKSAVGSGHPPAWAVGGENPLRRVPCAARSNSSQVVRDNARSAWRESAVFCGVLLAATVVICVVMPGIAEAANQQSSKAAEQQSSRSEQTKGPRTEGVSDRTLHPAWLRPAGDKVNQPKPGVEGTSDRVPLTFQTPRNPRVSALRVLPEGIFFSEGIKASRHEASRAGGATSAAMRLLVPSAFRPARAT